MREMDETHTNENSISFLRQFILFQFDIFAHLQLSAHFYLQHDAEIKLSI